MRYVLTPEQMRFLETEHMRATGLPSLELMERAAEAVTDALVDRFGSAEGHVCAFACGPGMNGGDGYAAARLWAARGGRSVVIPTCDAERLKGDARTNARAAEGVDGVYIASIARLADMPRPDAWVDALYGIGLSRGIGEEEKQIVDRMCRDRKMGSYVLAVDIPSGIDAGTGLAPGDFVRADETVSFEYLKLGHLLAEGLDASGVVRVASIGMKDAILPDGVARMVERKDLLPLFAPRARNTHKGHYGHLLLIAGSRGMAGAAVLAARAALSSGVGLLTVACPESIVNIVQSCVPCAMCLPLCEEDGAANAEAAAALEAAMNGKSALAVGPGLSLRVHRSIVGRVLKANLPAAIDADALNGIARSEALRAAFKPWHVITPHPGEAARLRMLTGRAVEDAESLHAMGPVALLKGAVTVIRGQNTLLSASGTPGMAKGGSGDVLTGILGALLARGVEPECAAWSASELHGLAGEAAARAKGVTAMTAEDQIWGLSAVYREMEDEAQRVCNGS